MDTQRLKLNLYLPLGGGSLESIINSLAPKARTGRPAPIARPPSHVIPQPAHQQVLLSLTPKCPPIRVLLPVRAGTMTAFYLVFLHSFRFLQPCLHSASQPQSFPHQRQQWLPASMPGAGESSLLPPHLCPCCSPHWDHPPPSCSWSGYIQAAPQASAQTPLARALSLTAHLDRPAETVTVSPHL